MELVSGNDDMGELLLMHIDHPSYIRSVYMYMYLHIYLYNIFPNNVEEFILYAICSSYIFKRFDGWHIKYFVSIHLKIDPSLKFLKVYKRVLIYTRVWNSYFYKSAVV